MLGPVGIFGEAYLFEQLAIIRIVVKASERREVFVAFHQQTFLVHVGEAQRAFYLGHAFGLAPSFHGIDHGAQHFHVVDEI